MNITFDVVVHFTNIFYEYLLIAFPSRYSEHSFNSAYYLVEKERPYREFQDLLCVEEKTGWKKAPVTVAIEQLPNS